MTQQIFLDYAATTPVSNRVRAAMEPYFTEKFYNPSALYLAAKGVRADVEAARARIASVLEVRAAELVFTAGTTEANNLAIRGVMERCAREYGDVHCVVSAIEHDSVIETVDRYAHDILPVTEQDIVDMQLARRLITDKTVLLTCMLANNEIGTVQPVAELTKLAAEIRTERQRVGNPLPLYVHTDAAQAFNYMNVLPNTLGVDLLVVGGSKIYGPKQTAVLFVKHGVRLEPQVTGGGHEWGLRAGTENVPGIIGLAEAIAETAELRAAESVRLASLQTQFMDGLAQSVPTARINGSRSHRLPNNVHLTIPGLDNETLVMQLDERGIMAAAGSACSASSEEPSHVLRALGLSEAAARSSLRFSMGRDTTDAEITRTLEVLADLCEPTQS